ncbi:siderophore-interacting protein [Photobacterium sp. CCB-ST2H9]|uniref:siderophore-interacting protein n=1 Tax=Photobacterium sp. CCB-ST2H9 TaxID=2912855 RepID=UPI0020056BB6|nr:siderophore-interacting protein [Photobacterium sp. CCB-ST2H9]UTM59513.1 siderophore-interacting protein [Photobacterium sp. CCB-ST2H9]
MQKRLQPKTFTVSETFDISPNMRRIVLTGEDIRHLPADSAGQYVKLLFTPEGSTDLNTLTEGQRPVMRTYTISEFDTVQGRFSIDFVKHHHGDTVDQMQGGYASHWAIQAQAGDQISIGGPNSIQGLTEDYDWVFIIGDMTALPSVQLKAASLPADARGYVVLDLHSDADLPALKLPAGVELILRTGDLQTAPSLAERVASLPWLTGKPAIWCACEFSNMRAIRQHLSQQPEFDRKSCYISSYWKAGVTEDGHKVIKRDDQENYDG